MSAQIQQVQQKVEYFVAQIDKELEKYPSIVKIERTTGVPKGYAAIGGFVLFTLLVFFNIFAGFLTNLIGFFLPAYFSMRALETPKPDDDVQWLTYWVVYGFFVFIESFVDLILYWFPFYFTFKTLAIVWLMLPQTQGAKLVYHKALRPIFANVIGANTNLQSGNPIDSARANLRQNAHAATGSSSSSMPAVPQ